MHRTACLILTCALSLAQLVLTARAEASSSGSATAEVLDASWQEEYELDLSDGSLVIRGIEIGGQTFDAALDTGCGDLLLPVSVSKNMTFEGLESLPSLDYSGASHDYPSGFLLTRRLGALRPSYESVVLMPDEILDIAILPLGMIQADLICFIASEGRCMLVSDEGEWGDALEAEAAVGGEMHYIPYWENLAGIFLGIEFGGQRYLAYVDTGASMSSFSETFIGEHPELFAATGESVEFSGIHGTGTTEHVYAMLAAGQLLSVDGESDLGFQLDVSGWPEAAPEDVVAGDYGRGFLPYLDSAAPNPWPVVMTIGMDLLSMYDFALDTRMKLLMLTPRSDLAAAP